MNEIPQPNEIVQPVDLVTQVASKLHDAWREPRRIPGTNNFEPRIKPAKDGEWSASHGGKTELDIANTPYEDLPKPWQAENKAAAESAVSEIKKAEASGTALDDDFIEAASATQHVAWLERNGSWAPVEQKLPYSELPESEKEKDRVVVRTALKVFSDSK
jgi:hypothetical protein